MDALSPPAWWMRLAAYLLVVAMFAFAIWRVEQVRYHDQAQSCVASWERTDQIRNMGEAVYRRNARTLIGLGASADPRLIAVYKAQVERDIVEIRGTLHNPRCDLAAAKRRLR